MPVANAALQERLVALRWRRRRPQAFPAQPSPMDRCQESWCREGGARRQRRRRRAHGEQAVRRGGRRARRRHQLAARGSLSSTFGRRAREYSGPPFSPSCRLSASRAASSLGTIALAGFRRRRRRFTTPSSKAQQPSHLPLQLTNERAHFAITVHANSNSPPFHCRRRT